MEGTRTSTQRWGNIVNKDELVFVGSCKSTKGVTLAVVDANTVIEYRKKLSDYADSFFSTWKVTNTISDSYVLPYAVEPSPYSVQKVISFASRIGFLKRLSEVDIKVIALTYTMESIRYGNKHLRDTPIASHITHGMPEKGVPGLGSRVYTSPPSLCIEGKWMLRTLSRSSVACISTKFSVQYMILQMGLRLVSPASVMQIFEMQRLVWKCYCCGTVTAEIVRVNCPTCGYAAVLCKDDVTIIKNSVHDHAPESNAKDGDKMQTINKWCNLPQDLLDLIIDKLYYTDRVRFQKVCKNWCIPIGTRVNKEFPMIICFNYSASSLSGMTLVDPIHKTVHKIWDSGSIYSNLFGNSHPVCTKNGWVTFYVDEPGNYIRFLWYNVFNGKLFTLPEFTDLLGVPCNVALFSSTNPTSPGCIFVVLHAEHTCLVGISTYQYGDEYWNTTIFGGGGHSFNSIRYFCTSSGDCYFVFSNGKLGYFSFEKQECIWLVESPCWSRVMYLHLIISDGVILVVRDMFIAGSCMVHRYEEKERGWVDEKSLGNRVLFLDRHGYCFRSASGDLSHLADTIICIPNHSRVVGYSMKGGEISNRIGGFDWIQASGSCRQSWIQPPL